MYICCIYSLSSTRLDRYVPLNWPLGVIHFFLPILQAYKEYSFPKTPPPSPEFTEQKDKDDKLCQFGPDSHFYDALKSVRQSLTPKSDKETKDVKKKRRKRGTE